MSALDDLAESHVLGLLDPAETAAVDARVSAPRDAEDRALALALGAARDRLLPLDLTAPPLELPPGAWDRLAAALAPLSTPEAAPIPADRPAPAPRAPAPPRSGAAARAPARPAAPTRDRWRLATFGALAAALLLAATLAWQVMLRSDPAVLVVLLDSDGGPTAVLEGYPDGSLRVTTLRGVETLPAGVTEASLQLWTKPDPDGPPVSVGLLDAVARMVVRNPDLSRPADGQLFEITVEPEGGSPTGLPTGPVFGIGNAQIPVTGAS